MGCPKCDFAHYGARFVYGDWSYLYVLIKVLWYPDNEPFPTFIKFSEISKQLVFKVLGYCEICRHFFVYPKRFHTSTSYDHEESNYKIACKQCTEDIKECVRSDWEDYWRGRI